MKKSNNIYDNYDNFLNVEEAPLEYALNDEETTYYIKENFEPLEDVKRGDIVFVNTFAYSSGYVGKNHLFIILDSNKYVPFEYFGMIISSNIKKLFYKYNIKLDKDNKNNLKKDSIVKTDCIYNLKKENIKFVVGHLDEEIIKLFERKYKEFLDEKNEC